MVSTHSPKLRNVIMSFLKGCDLIYPAPPSYPDFEAKCLSEIEKRGYITAENKLFQRFLPAGIAMACNAYHHQSHEIQVFICLYTAFLVYLDDVFEKDIAAVQPFNHKFITGQKQNCDLLDHFAALLLEMPVLFGVVEANIMTTSTLNLVTALSIEHEFSGVKLEGSSFRFPTFSRVMSGASETYTVFIFPKEVPLCWKLQALPDCMVYINNGNDILSFYKEYLSADTVNRVSLTAQCRKISADIVLDELVDEAIMANSRILSSLALCNEALSSYMCFSQGYIGFHASLVRYRLHELNLLDPHNADPVLVTQHSILDLLLSGVQRLGKYLLNIG